MQEQRHTDSSRSARRCQPSDTQLTARQEVTVWIQIMGLQRTEGAVLLTWQQLCITNTNTGEHRSRPRRSTGERWLRLRWWVRVRGTCQHSVNRAAFPQSTRTEQKRGEQLQQIQEQIHESLETLGRWRVGSWVLVLYSWGGSITHEDTQASQQV